MASEGLAALVVTVIFGVLIINHLCCTRVEKQQEPRGGQAAVPGRETPGQPIAGDEQAAPAGQARIADIAPARGRSVAGGALPKLTGFPGQFRLGEGVTFGVIRIFPIYSNREVDVPQEYLSLAEAQEKELVEISELKESATVNTVEITNKADKPIYVISGDIIKGGNQDRVIAMDMVILPGKNESVAAGVFCVERGRWAESGMGGRFAASDGQACLNLKKCLGKGGVSQSEVWSKVGEINEKLGTESSTGTYRRALEDNSVESKLEPYIEEFTEEFKNDDKIVGFAVCVGKKVIACDIFLNPLLLAKMRDKLITSYVMGALTEEDKPGAPSVTAAEVAKFLKQAEEAEVSIKKEEKNYKIYMLKYGKTEGYYSEVGGKKTHFFLGSE
jgi:hypothetical protein